MTRLVSMDTESINGLKTAKEKMGAETFANGDQTLTLPEGGYLGLAGDPQTTFTITISD